MLYHLSSALHVVRLTTVAGCLWFATLVIPDHVHSDILAYQPPFASIMARYTEAMDSRAPNEVLATIHSQSPLFTVTIQQIRQIFPLYDIEVLHQDFRDLGSDGRDHVATVTLSYRKRSGPIFQNNATKAAVVFRQEDGTWKIWAILVVELTPLP